MYPIYTQEREATDRLENVRLEHIVEDRPATSWIAVLTLVLVILTFIVLGNLVAGNDGETEPTDVTVDVTTDFGS